MSKKEIGTAYVVGAAGVDDNGEAGIEGPTVYVNQEPRIPAYKHAKRIFGRKFTVTEEEDPSAFVNKDGGMVSYRKRIKGQQEPFEIGRPGKIRGEEYNGNENEEPSGLTPLAVLKNQVDNIAQSLTTNWWVTALGLLVVAIIGAVAFGMALD